jgi:hypothetical protein
MQHFYRIATGVNVVPLMVAIARRPELWREDSYLRHYPQGPFGQCESIMLRFPKKVELETEDQLELYKTNKLPGFDQHESIDYPAYMQLHEARPLVRQVFHTVNGERLGRVMINKVKPGGRIFRHADTPEHANYYRRFHIVLSSTPGARFLCDNEEVYMATGEVWWFNNRLEHEIINTSNQDRVHLVMDARCTP